MAGLAVGVSALVADGLLVPKPADAAPDPVLLGQPNTATGLTEISNTNGSTATAALQCDDVGGGTGPALVAMLTNAENLSPAIQASTVGTGPAIEASTAVRATTTGDGAAVTAVTSAAATAMEVGDGGVGTGAGLVVNLSYSPNESTVMEVTTDGLGYVIYATCTGSTNPHPVLTVLHRGLGSGIDAVIDNQGNIQPVIAASTNGPGPSLQASDGPGGLGGGITATIRGDLNYSPPLTATTAGRGPAIRATVENPASGGPAFEGSVDGLGPAVSAKTSGTASALLGEITNTGNSSPAVSGVTAGKGSGVAGSGAAAGAAGVSGVGTHGATGVRGSSDSGVGVHAASKNGAALEVVGKVIFSRSGIATIPSHEKSLKVDLAGVSTDSMVFATLQKALGPVGVANVVPAASSFTINLSEVAPSAVRVAWMVLG